MSKKRKVSDRIADTQEVVAYFTERIKHYQELKRMYIAGELHAYRDISGTLVFKSRLLK